MGLPRLPPSISFTAESYTTGMEAAPQGLVLYQLTCLISNEAHYTARVG